MMPGSHLFSAHNFFVQFPTAAETFVCIVGYSYKGQDSVMGSKYALALGSHSHRKSNGRNAHRSHFPQPPSRLRRLLIASINAFCSPIRW
jgi:hypothetical protein